MESNTNFSFIFFFFALKELNMVGTEFIYFVYEDSINMFENVM